MIVQVLHSSHAYKLPCAQIGCFPAASCIRHWASSCGQHVRSSIEYKVHYIRVYMLLDAYTNVCICQRNARNISNRKRKIIVRLTPLLFQDDRCMCSNWRLSRLLHRVLSSQQIDTYTTHARTTVLLMLAHFFFSFNSVHPPCLCSIDPNVSIYWETYQISPCGIGNSSFVNNCKRLHNIIFLNVEAVWFTGELFVWRVFVYATGSGLHVSI